MRVIQRDPPRKASDWESEVKEHFDQYALTYAAGYNGETIFGYVFRRRQQLVLSLLEGMKEGSVLDVGCGPGIYCGPCVQRGLSYVGLDVSPQMIHECRTGVGDVRGASFLVGRIQDLGFADQSFDAILCLGALEYVPEHEESSALAELARVLKPGGTLIFSCANKLSPYRLWDRAYSQLMWIAKNRVPVPIRDFREHVFRRELQVHGLTACSVLYFGINLFLSPLERKFPSQAVQLASRLERFAGGWFGHLGMAFLVVARHNQRFRELGERDAT